MDSSAEIIWTRYAINSHKLSRTQLQTCIEEQGQLKAKGFEKTLSEIIISHGYIDKITAYKLMTLEGMIPGYTIKDVLGSGGLGIVYKAFSEKLEKEVAIKILNPEYTDNTVILTRFLREIDISIKLEHPNIVKGIDSGRVDDIYYLVLEYIDGVSLSSYVAKFGAMSDEKVFSVAATVSNALYYAWGKGLTHRDIKPGNIMLSKTGQLKVCDFGLAKLADANVGVTMTGTIVGSPYYISPEQVNGLTLDYRSDIYSLGATLYFLSTGKVMFDEKTMIAACNSHINKKPVPPSQIKPISPIIESLILKMVRKEPEERCKSPEEYMGHLKSVARELKQSRKTKEDGTVSAGEVEIKVDSGKPAEKGHTMEDKDLHPEEKQSKTEISLSKSGERIFEKDMEEIEPKPGEMTIKSILIVGLKEEDEKTLTEELERNNLQVFVCSDAERALDVYSANTPDIIVSSTDLKGKMTAWDFFSALRQSKDLHRKLHLVLFEEKVNAKERMQAMLLGIKHYITKPVTQQAIATILEYANKVTFRETTKIALPKLKGNLSVMSLPELLQTLQASEKIGILTVQAGEREGMIYIQQGKVWHCVLGNQSPKSALFDLISWNRGTFVFQEIPALNVPATLNLDIMNILLDSMRVLDEVERIKGAMGSSHEKDFETVRFALLEGKVTPEIVLQALEAFPSQAKPGESFVKFLLRQGVLDEQSYKIIRDIQESSTQKPTTRLPQTSLLGKKEEKTESKKEEKGSPMQKEEKKTTTKSNINKPTTVSGPKNKIQDVILQQLLLSLDIMNMSQLSECISHQVDFQLQGAYKPLADIIIEQGHLDSQYMQNLRYFRDEDGESLIPNYEIVNVIGEGGLAVVYLGRNINTNETVAIKVFAPITSDASSTIARFMREAEAAKKLNHPNIVKANDFGTIHGIYYLVMEYIPGLSLSQIISKIGRLEEQKALAIMEQLADALTYAWKQNIIHRDIKPGNILSDGDILKICDLGLAKALESEIEVTQEGSILGTPQYMSPEQFQPEKQLDFRTDVYSLGVTLYVMLTGNLPFTASTKIGLAQAHLMQDPPPIEKFNVMVSKPTKMLLNKMLCKDREKRCKEKDELAEDIRRVQQGKFPKGVSQMSSMLGRFNKKAVIGGAVGGFVVLVALMAFLFSGNQFEKVKKEVSLLVYSKKYDMATDKIFKSSLSSEEKEKLLALIKEAQAKDIKILEIMPANESKTEQESLKITGSFQCGELDYVLVNNRRAEIIQFGTLWKFEAETGLTVGRNPISIMIVSRSGQKEQFEQIIIREMVDRVPPVITILEPKGIEANKKIEFVKPQLVLKGYAIDNQKVATVIVNEKAIPVLDAGGKMAFEMIYNLGEGTQTITIKARDEKENEASFVFEAYLPPRGWFGEQMSPGIAKGKEIGEYIWAKDNSIMVYVPEGEFWFGENKSDMKKVYLSAFYIDKYEMTWKHYVQFCRETNYKYPRKPKWGVREDHPVIDVSYEDAVACAKWLGKEVPTVAQWMKAGRGGIEVPDWKSSKQSVVMMRNPNPFRLYPWGDTLPNMPESGNEKVYRCNYCADDSFVGQGADGYMYTARVGEFSGWNSPYGCADMAGNVFEICSDYFSSDYHPNEGETDPKGPSSISEYRTKMGGGFYSLSKKCMVGSAARIQETRGDSQSGFRLVVPVKK